MRFQQIRVTTRPNCTLHVTTLEIDEPTLLVVTVNQLAPLAKVTARNMYTNIASDGRQRPDGTLADAIRDALAPHCDLPQSEFEELVNACMPS